MTLEELILAIEVEREQAMKVRARAIGEIKVILAKARNEGRANLTEEEDADIKAAFARRDKAKTDLVGIEQKLSNAKRAKEAEDETEQGLEYRMADPATAAAQKPSYDRVARIGQEERTYHRGNRGGGKGGAFLRDVVRSFLFRDPEADQRLFRHMQEERVERGDKLQRAAGDAGTAQFTGLVVPQYLTEMYAPKARARRPFADACNQHDLPEEGMTVNISQITTGSTVTNQATEFAAASATSMDDTLLTENVKTASGQQSLSRQAIERGKGIEDVTMDDLQRAWATNLDSTLVNEAVTGLAALAVAVAYNDTSPTGPELYPKILGGMAGSEAVFLGYATPDIAVMHSRRWYWLQAQMTSTWPMFGQQNIPSQLAGVSLAEQYGAGVRGILPNGTVVIVDNNCPTAVGAGTEDEIYIAASDECHLWEDPNAPQFIRAEQPQAANLAVTLVLYGYYAYCFRRFPSGGVAKVAGTGLIAPVF